MSKIIRILVGMPFVMILWVLIVMGTPFTLLMMWAAEGNFRHFDKTDMMLPIKFIKHVYNT
jgi:hypothetical protein